MKNEGGKTMKKIEWLDAPEENGWKSACGRFIINRLPVEYTYGRRIWRGGFSIHPCRLTDNDPKWWRMTFDHIHEAMVAAERRVSE